MAKRRSRDQNPPAGQKVAPNNPFGALGALRDALPSAPVEATPATEPVTSSANDAPGVAPATPGGKVVVRRETKGRKGKTVTRIAGIHAHELIALAKSLKKALGCGASIEGDDLILLGSLVDCAADWLEKRGARRVVRSN